METACRNNRTVVPVKNVSRFCGMFIPAGRKIFVKRGLLHNHFACCSVSRFNNLKSFWGLLHNHFVCCSVSIFNNLKSFCSLLHNHFACCSVSILNNLKSFCDLLHNHFVCCSVSILKNLNSLLGFVYGLSVYIVTRNNLTVAIILN